MGKLFEKVGIFSLAKPFAVAMGFIGLILAAIYVFGGIIDDIFIAGRVTSFTDVLKFFLLLPLRLLALIVIPLPFVIFGFIVGTIGAILNNLVVGWLSKN